MTCEGSGDPTDGEEGDAEVMNNEACFPSLRKDRYLLSITNNVKQTCNQHQHPRGADITDLTS